MSTIIGEKKTMTFLAEPADVNFSGKVHGGEVMKWMDQAGYAYAVQYSKGYAVTRLVDNIEFVNPMRIGDLVRVETTLLSTGTTSMTFRLEVYSESLTSGLEKLNCTCQMVFVAVDENGKKRSIQ